jgi:rhodanese-related sulfurtransferase
MRRPLLPTVTTGADVGREKPPIVTTQQLRRLLGGPRPPWLVFAADRETFSHGHIPGSLTATDDQLLAALPLGAAVVVYGENRQAQRAEELTTRLITTGREARWYPGGLQAWTAAGLTTEGPDESGKSP